MALDSLKNLLQHEIVHPLTVYKSPFDKKRIGRENDGGYVICTGEPYECDVFLSAGISDDISFEEAFMEDHPSVPCFAFDGTTDKFPESKFPINFFKQNIDHNQNLHWFINKYDRIFIKMDIEGAEFDWIHSLTEEQLMKINQIVIEFHFPFEASKWYCMEKLARTHRLVHLHANNCCGTRSYMGFNTPCVFECTYISKKFADRLPRTTETIPTPIDQKNCLHLDEVQLSGEPYNV